MWEEKNQTASPRKVHTRFTPQNLPGRMSTKIVKGIVKYCILIFWQFVVVFVILGLFDMVVNVELQMCNILITDQNLGFGGKFLVLLTVKCSF